MEQLKQKVFDLCEENNIHYTDLLKYIIFTELNYNAITIEEMNKILEDEYLLLWDLQPTIEDDEEHAFAVQHARDIYDLLLGDYYEEN